MGFKSQVALAPKNTTRQTLGIPSSQNEPLCMFFLLHGGLHRDWRWVQHPFLEGPMAAWAEHARSCPQKSFAWYQKELPTKELFRMQCRKGDGFKISMVKQLELQWLNF
jgi:hypothetical protein